ncbi:hypothetical protein J2Y89_002984 [Curtobacterium herbarum]|uniref:hypothetical protein n=1 Tax=Curtobacterium herbarum TaxID=150122 RepID=UPI00209D0CC6|nr:hypothetical protein [Curtobacterium herbarum]MCP1504240.1 hypothetical protein [Curtobacterium herbarum]
MNSQTDSASIIAPPNAARIGRSLPNPLLGTVVFIMLALVAPLIIIASTSSNGVPAWIGCYAIAALAAARFSWVVSSARHHIVDMIIAVFVYGFLGIAPMVQLRERADVSTTPGFMEQFAWQTVTVIFVGYAAILVGAVVGGRVSRSIPASRPPALFSPERVVIVTLAAFMTTAYYVRGIGVGSLFHTRAVIDAERGAVWPNPTTAALITGFSAMGLLVAAVAQILLFRQRRERHEKTPVVLLVVTIAALLVVVNPIASPRYTVGTVYVALLAACGVWSSLRKFRSVAVSLLAALFFVFPVASTFRNTLDAKVQFTSPLKSLLSGDFDSFDQINNTMYYIAERGITWGDQLLGVVFFWVPRDWWDGKAVDTGILLAEFRNYSFTNLSAPLWAELMINGGWPLLIVGMLFVGFAVRRWDARLAIEIARRGTPGLIGCIAPIYLLIVLRGSLLQSMASLSIILVLGLFLSARQTVHRHTLRL